MRSAYDFDRGERLLKMNESAAEWARDRRFLAARSIFDPKVEIGHFYLHPDEEERKFPARDQVLRVLEGCQNQEIEIIHPGHELYPREFFAIEKPPLFLTYQGSPCWLRKSALAIVGSREPHPRTLEWLDQHLLGFLRACPVLTISGAARGVDQRVHLLSLRLNLPTLAFLPAGFGHVYPSSFARMREEIWAAGGAIMSEYAPDVEMRKHHFLQRNRLIAAMAPVLFVAEANRRSGSLMTARLAQAGNARICVLPSFPGDGAGSGTLELLIEGATPIRDAQDLLAICHLEMSSL